VAIGRRRRCTIFSLETGEGDISDMKDLCKHIEEYYKKLEEKRGAQLGYKRICGKEGVV
jgi:hypothetical protein